MAWSKESRQSRGYGAEWEKVRAEVIKRDLGMCQPCKNQGRAAIGREVDHVVPKAEAERLRWTQAQQDALSNLQCICAPCHKAKTAKDNGKVYRPKQTIGLDGWPVGE